MTYNTLPYRQAPTAAAHPIYGGRNLRRDLNVIFAALTIHCCSYFFSWIINDAVYLTLSALFPFDEAHYAVLYASEAITYTIEFIIPAVIIMVFGHISPFRLAQLPEGGQTVRGRPKIGLFYAVFAGLCAVETAGIISGMILDMFESAGFDFYVGLSEELPADIGGIIAYLVSVAVVPGFVEELLFRGCVAGVLKRYNAAFAVILSSLLFALMHCTVQQFFYAFCAGLVFGWLAVYTGRLWPGMLIHMLNNAISVGYDYIYTMFDRDLYAGLYVSISSVIMALGVFGMIMLMRRGGRLPESVNEVSLRAAAGAAIRPLSVIYIIVVALVTVMVLSV